MMNIDSAEPFYSQIAAVMGRVIPAGTDPHLIAQVLYVPGMPPLGQAAGPIATAAVDEGRWVVRCPFCPSAQMGAKGDPWFYCVECCNRGADGKSVPVEWPDNADAIEAELSLRTVKMSANWFGESVDQLRLENVALGVPTASVT